MKLILLAAIACIAAAVVLPGFGARSSNIPILCSDSIPHASCSENKWQACDWSFQLLHDLSIHVNTTFASCNKTETTCISVLKQAKTACSNHTS